MRNFYYCAGATVPVEADLCWGSCRDGVCVISGTLPGNGFTWGRGITVPEEIDGVPVTELDCTFMGVPEFVDGPNLKRVRIRCKQDLFHRFSNGSTAPFGRLHGPVEQIDLISDIPVRVSLYSNTLTAFSVSAPDIRLGEGGFHGCPNLHTVGFYGPVNADNGWDCSAFEKDLFRDCRQLTSVRGEFRGDYLAGGTFSGCTALTTAPSMRVKRMDDAIFRGCGNLSTVHLAQGMTHIGAAAFQGCLSLKDIYIPDTVTSLGSSVFQDCRALRRVHIPGGLTAIPDYCFYSCHRLGKVFLPDGITAIGDGAFADCPGIRDPWMPGHLESIGTRAFYGCVFTRPVTIPASVKKIGPQAFGASSHVQLRGVPGSEAERYARKNRLTFIPMEDPAP